LGMNQGIEPLLLQKNELGMAVNCTVRGDFVKPRSRFRKIALDFGSDATAAAIVGAPYIWQGGQYYKPDTGPEQLVMVVHGRFFTLTPSNTTPTAVVTEIPVAGGNNPPTQPQAWLWQSEKWI